MTACRLCGYFWGGVSGSLTVLIIGQRADFLLRHLFSEVANLFLSKVCFLQSSLVGKSVNHRSDGCSVFAVLINMSAGLDPITVATC